VKAAKKIFEYILLKTLEMFKKRGEVRRIFILINLNKGSRLCLTL